MNKKIYLQKIRENFSGLKFNQARLIRSGYDNDIIVLDEKIVFSFPKQKYDCLEKIQRQIRIVPLLSNKISLPIPGFKYIPEDKLFVGYKYIKGVPLSNKIVKGLSIKEKESCARQLANFISELHSFPIQSAKKSGVDVYDKLKNKNIKQVVVHQDLIDEHIIFDEKTKKIVGIIDFGDIVIADPALEFSRIWRYGEYFLDLILKHYKIADRGIKERSHLLWLASKKA